MLALIVYLFAVLGLILLIRDAWNLIPDWIKRPRRRGGRSRSTARTSTVENGDGEDLEAAAAVMNHETTPLVAAVAAAASTAPPKQLDTAQLFNDDDKDHQDENDDDDMSNVLTIIGKLQALFTYMNDKLNLSNDERGNIWKPFLAAAQLMVQIKSRHFENLVEKLFQGTRPGNAATDLNNLDVYLEYADSAYETEDTDVLKENLHSQGYFLLKHDRTILPGRLGYYVAINKTTKTALIGVKGTSSIEDMLTDCCGNAVPYELCNAEDQAGDEKGQEDKDSSSGNININNNKSSTTFTCHEGILISAQRLADDLQTLVEELILPAGFITILMVGHSLGAGGAALCGLILRQRIPALRYSREALQVYAFACPPVLDLASAQSCAPFITTIVNNSDIIPRCSLANLAIAVSIVKDVQEKLEANNMDGVSSWADRIAFFQKLSQGDQGELLMQVSEFWNSVCDATREYHKRHPDHLFVPGKVIFMYSYNSKIRNDKATTTTEATISSNDEGQKQKDQNDDADLDADEHAKDTTIKHEFVVANDGSFVALRLVDWDVRMLSDHSCISYRSSLKNFMTPKAQLVQNINDDVDNHNDDNGNNAIS